jgi:hypothetical protein
MDFSFWVQLVTLAMALVGGVITIVPPATKKWKWVSGAAFGVLAVIATLLLNSQSKQARDQQRQLQDEARTANLNLENIKGQLTAFSAVLGDFVKAGKDADLNKIAVAMQQALRNVAVGATPATSLAKSAEPKPVPVPSSTDPRFVSVPEMARAGAKLEAFVGQQRLDAAAKPENTIYVSVVVSRLTKAKGEPTEATIREVVAALQKTPGVLVFFTNSGYQLRRDAGTTQFGSGSGLAAFEARVLYFSMIKKRKRRQGA